MKIVICDGQTDLARDLQYEINRLKAALPGAQIVICEYTGNKRELIQALQDADAVINTYVPFDREVLSQCKRLKCIALNAVGYDMVDVPAASENGVMVCPAAEYCTIEVAEHTLALILALCRGLRTYIAEVEGHRWNYMSAGELERVSGKTIALFGFGRIGRAVAVRAQALGMRVQVVSRSLTPETAEELNLEKVDWRTAMETSDILSNHMALTRDSSRFFSLEKFQLCRKRPLFINTGRGGSVVEEDLVRALDLGYLRGAGLDVLSSEKGDLRQLKLLGRDNVIITPHAGFFSVQAARDLQNISCDTVISALTGKLDGISKIVNQKELQ